MKKLLILIGFCIVFLIQCFAADIPLIFINGHKSDGIPWKINSDENVGGWATWNPQTSNGEITHSTSMCTSSGHSGHLLRYNS